MKREALKYLSENWHVGLVGSAEAATLLRMRPNTLRTRIARNQALAIRDGDDRQRAAVSFTGYQLVYNLIQDRLLENHFPLEPRVGEGFPEAYAGWVHSSILNEPYQLGAIIRFDRQNGNGVSHLFEDGNVEAWTGDAALILPIGTMVLRMAINLYVKSGKPEVVEALAKARDFLSDTEISVSHPDE
ncbi:hypothetical protein [Roseovarius sp.]|uniref:hypothetical protein n=1 Tax=Roseovarius sp. TaxID=1486281 RepID=UPI00260E84CD|nr:hypothetical protein [Roseovarius sp.]MDM8168572.1 hypothetical protein [Roseovarius sp.]